MRNSWTPKNLKGDKKCPPAETPQLSSVVFKAVMDDRNLPFRKNGPRARRAWLFSQTEKFYFLLFVLLILVVAAPVLLTTPLSPRPSPSSLIMEFVRRPATRRARINNWLFLGVGVLFYYRVRKQAGLTTHERCSFFLPTQPNSDNSMTHTLSHDTTTLLHTRSTIYSWLGEGKQTFLAIWTN